MAHNLNYDSKKKEYAFYSRKEVPWHGLGQFIQQADTATEALELAHLDYEVKTGDVFCSFIPKGYKAVATEGGGFDFVQPHTNEVFGHSVKKGAKIPKYKCVYRDDTKDIFDIVSDRYEVIQNFEALDIIYGIIKGPEVTDKNQIIIETAGALGKGETIFVTAKMPSYIVKINGKEDVIEKYVVFTSSHDKSSKVCALITDVRVVCNNTLNMALNTKNKVSLRHTKNVRDKFNQFAELLGVANKYSQNVKEVMEHLSTVQVTQEMINAYIYDMYVPTDKLRLVKEVKDINLISSELVSNKLKNKINDVKQYLEKGPGQSIGVGTAYWLYNGVSSYIHNGVNYSDGEDKFTNVLYGTGSSNIVKAYDKILDYV